MQISIEELALINAIKDKTIQQLEYVIKQLQSEIEELKKKNQD